METVERVDLVRMVLVEITVGFIAIWSGLLV